MILAKNNQAQALVNPDNFRVFAEMVTSPDTRWGIPTPVGQAAPPGKKRRSSLGDPAHIRS